MNARFVAFAVFVGVFVSCCMATMNIITLPDAVGKMGAMCMDGSPAAYYFKAASSAENSTKWVLFFQGGGWCYKEEECAVRAPTHRGSSKYMPSTDDEGGMMSEDPQENPDFYSWNHVVFAYCDGASFTGAADEPIVVGEQKVYFRGYYNLKAIMNDLLENHGMNMATEVLLTGASAGGLSVFIHADQIGEMLPKSVKRYKAAPGSGLFMKHANVYDEPVYENEMQHVFVMQNSSAGVDPHCLLAKSPMYMYLCMFGSETIRSTQTPMFVMNSMYDSWATSCIMTAEPEAPSATTDDGNCSAAPGWYDCIVSQSCTDEQWDEFNTKWGDDFRTMLKSDGFHNRGNGMFAYSCHYHCAEFIGLWNRMTIDGVTLRQAFTKWYLSNDEDASKHTYVDCRINGNFLCNPTCG